MAAGNPIGFANKSVNSAKAVAGTQYCFLPMIATIGFGSGMPEANHKEIRLRHNSYFSLCSSALCADLPGCPFGRRSRLSVFVPAECRAGCHFALALYENGEFEVIFTSGRKANPVKATVGAISADGSQAELAAGPGFDSPDVGYGGADDISYRFNQNRTTTGTDSACSPHVGMREKNETTQKLSHVASGQRSLVD